MNNSNELGIQVPLDVIDRIESDYQNETELTIVPTNELQTDEVDSRYSKTKNMAEGMMDIALLTANANQLRFLFSYNTESKTFYVIVGLIITSLIIQIAVGIGLIFERRLKMIPGNRQKAKATKDILVIGVFLVTVINIFATAFTTTDKANMPTKQQ